MQLFTNPMNRIVIDSEICGEKPTIRGTRIMVRNILGMIAAGESVAQILIEYPQLRDKDVTEALKYAAQVIDEEQVVCRAR